MRLAIGRLMARSKREIPHYYLSNTVDLTAAMGWLHQRNRELAISQRLVPAALLLKAAALAARQVPELNGYWDNDQFNAAGAVHLGVPVSLRGGGLLTPAIRDAADLPPGELMARLHDLVIRARAGRLRRAELTDAAITVTKPRRPGRRGRLRSDLPASGRTGRDRQGHREAGRRQRHDRRAADRDHHPVRRSPGQRRLHRRTLPNCHVRPAATTGGAVTPEQARHAIEESLGQVAPDADTRSLAPDADLRDTLELDSLDFLRFVEELSQRSSRRIEEDDYPQLATMASAIKFFSD
jgi:acyl carrier protein